MAANATFALKPGVWFLGSASSSLLLIRDENPRRRQAENPLSPLSNSRSQLCGLGPTLSSIIVLRVLLGIGGAMARRLIDGQWRGVERT